MTRVEAALVAAAAIPIVGYHLYFLWTLSRRPGKTMIGTAREARRAWVENIVARGDAILAVQTLRNWIMTTSFLASSAILIAAALLGFLVSAERVPALIHRINLLGSTGQALLTVKILLLLANFFVLFFNFSLSLRYYNYLALTINAGRESDQQDIIDRSFGYLTRGANHYTLGMRGYYFALPLALWLLGPTWLLVGSLLLTAVLYWHDRA